jgi:hypothetical protein
MGSKQQFAAASTNVGIWHKDETARAVGALVAGEAR